MLEVTPTATTQLKEYFQDRDLAPIRVFLNNGGCGGPSLAMAVDEERGNDEKIEIDGFTYVVDKAFLEEVKPIKVDFTPSGFALSCAVEFGAGGGCGGCGSSSNCCSSN